MQPRISWQTFLGISPYVDTFDAITSRKTQGGAFMPSKQYGDHTVPLNITYALVSPKAPDWFMAECLFEEMDHSLLSRFPPRSTALGEFWPSGDHKSGQVLEEGFVGVEKYLYIQEHYPDYFTDPKMPLVQVQNHLEGKHATAITSSTDPTILVFELLRRGGGEEFVQTMRAARANQPKALVALRKKVNDLLGDQWMVNMGFEDEFTKLCKMPTTRINSIWWYIRHLQRIPITSTWPLKYR